MDIEKIAKTAIENEVLKYNNFLTAYLSDNDRTPLFDGYIYIYKLNTKYKNNKDFLGKVNVQIKGKKVSKISKGNGKYSIKIETLEAYRREKNGVLFLVVQMEDYTNTKIFYKNLLPVDIETILLKTIDGQKTVSIDIKPIKEKSSSSLKMVCQNFLKNSQEQLNIKIKNINDIEDIKEIEIPIVGDKEYIEDYLINNDVYSYAIDGVTGFKYALPKLKEIQYSKEIRCPIRINNIEYYNSLIYFRNQVDNYVMFGKSTKFYLNTNKINFCLKGSIYERIHDIKFILDLIRYKEIKIGKNIVSSTTFFNEDKIIKLIDTLSNDLKKFEKIKSIFDKFNVKFEKNLDELTEIEIKNLYNFIELNEGEIIDGIIDTSTYYINIAEYRIAFLAIIKDNNKVEIYNYFSDLSNKMVVFYYDDNKKQISISPYINLTAEDLISLSNVNIEVMKQTFQVDNYNKTTCEKYNLWMLELLKAYDKTKDKQWIDFAEFIINKILDSNYLDIYEINRMQIIKRKRELTESEKELLYYIRNNNIDSLVQCAIAILLENKSDFERSFSHLSEREKNIFKELPIYNLKNF